MKRLQSIIAGMLLLIDIINIEAENNSQIQRQHIIITYHDTG